MLRKLQTYLLWHHLWLHIREDPSYCISYIDSPKDLVSLNTDKLTHSLFMCGTPGNI